MSRDPIGERGGINLYQYVGNRPVSQIDPLGLMASKLGPPEKGCKKCAVDSHHVSYTQYDEQGGQNAAFAIAITYTFRKDNDHDPKCCAFKQLVKVDFMVITPDGTVETHHEAEHDDGYSRSFDMDGSPSLSDPSFKLADFPGWAEIPGFDSATADPTASIDATFVFTQVIYAPGDADCEKNDNVLITGPHTLTIKGKYPRTFGGVPTIL